MPDNDQPRWPTGDEDASSRGEEATAGLPLPKRNSGTTDRLAVPNVTPGDGPGSWFRPNVPPEPVPGVNAPAEPAGSAPSWPPQGGQQAEQSREEPGGERTQQVQWRPESSGEQGSQRREQAGARAEQQPRPESRGEQASQVQWRPESPAAQAQRPEARERPEARQDEPRQDQPRQDEPRRPESRGEQQSRGEQVQQVPWVPVERPGQPSRGTSERSGPAFQPARRPAPPAGQESRPGQQRPPAQSPQSQPSQPSQGEQFSAFRDESPAAGPAPDSGQGGQSGQGWAAFRPVTPREAQSSPPAGEGWTAFRAESGSTPPENQSRSPEARSEESQSRGREDAQLRNPGARPGDNQSRSPEARSEESRLRNPGDRSEDNYSRHPEAAGSRNPGEQRRDVPQGRGGAWSQQLEVPVLPEPPRGSVPPASGGPARPMRIEPSGGQFPAEATVGIPRPPSAQQPPPKPGSRPEQQPANRPEQQPAGWPEQQPGHQEAAFAGQRPAESEPEQFASEATVGIPRPPDGFPPAAPADGGRPKRRRKLLVVGIVAVLVLAAAGVASAMPKVANQLGLPWAPNAPKGSEPDPADVSLALHGPDTSGPGASPAGVASALAGPAGAPALSQLTGSVIDPSSGSVLWDHASNTALTPASTTKILTVAAALLSMDPTKRLTTKVVQGDQPGTVVLVGGGDPTLTALPQGTDSPLYPGAAHVDDLVTQVKKAAGNVSSVQVDVSAYSGPVTAKGWEAGDAPSTYGAPIVPVMTDGGRGNPKVDETPRSGNPATSITQLLAQKLGGNAGGVTKAPAGAKVLGQVQSAPLPELAYALLQISDNVLADALGRQVAIATGGEASFDGAAAAVKKVLGDHGFDVSGLQLFDTSGLSNMNKVPARLLTQVLAAAAGPDGKNENTPKLRPLLAGLPVAGSPAGTLAGRYGSGQSAAGKGWVRAKTGTLTGVNTLAGYVLDKDNRVLAFAFMSNGSDKDPGQAALDVLATTLRNCGCQ
ncbi:D-alanyl-D-alanine carboxypeptidase/D-alanyl-D-alanine endopeptidase [Amycolatopsis jiangsuensis]|uniref:D-alanyl-D-alanine carboxypeptidase/D-alanyl-D-alanine-endopeptidase (Penicillin-binding protein 4) n=1 Tax=Amycolatopsis jiangsuensis TaxID=1181879 RepID=A0A840J2X4_9PSEU|nr:D-alanyl-D-alanine carboxypeptidase/D-alanyl-D-alanine-endopeptidase [Amycolatopsis jiangsuensis]MBB4687772.1 D-alanyl-D-alanine carboxypeptidase/D-alanyl-D-alanine-endopeptidase (penicillin-binding protein 4) [Amycolatopsis jiangsuensis]